MFHHRIDALDLPREAMIDVPGFAPVEPVPTSARRPWYRRAGRAALRAALIFLCPMAEDTIRKMYPKEK